MKKMIKSKYIIGMMALGFIALSQTSCGDAKDSEIDNLVYISEAAMAKTKTLTMEDNGAKADLTVRLAKSIGSDVNVKISIDEAYLAAYNKINETDYKVPDAANFTIPTAATIKAGTVSAAPVSIEVKSFSTNGVKYAIPVCISEVDGGVDKAEASSHFIYLLEKPLKQLVPRFTWYNAMQAAPLTDWRIEVPNYTLEWWSKMSSSWGDGGYTTNNQAIFNSGGKDAAGKGIELYIRFGDLIYSDGYSYKNNFLQVKTFGSQFDTGNPVKGFGLTGKVWYHFAITYDASTGTTLLYKNGEQVASLSTSTGRAMWIDRLQMISSGQQYFPDYCEMCQVRMWKTTRTVNQIKNGMYSEVDPTNPDLILYLPMNEGSGDVLHDITGHGHDVTIGSLSHSSEAKKVTWTQYTFAK